MNIFYLKQKTSSLIHFPQNFDEWIFVQYFVHFQSNTNFFLYYDDDYYYYYY